MPIAEIELPDGRIAEFEVPEGTTEAQILQFAQNTFGPQQTSFRPGAAARKGLETAVNAAQETAQLERLENMRAQNTPAGQKPAPSTALQNAQKRIDDRALTDPTHDMSGTERFIAGYGGVLPELARGANQRVAEIGNDMSLANALSPEQLMTLQYSGKDTERKIVPDEVLRQVQAEVDEARRLEAPLMNTASGRAGKITGTIANTLPLMFVPGANSYGGAAMTGAGLGYLQPTAEGESAGENAAWGAGFGLTGKAVADVLARALRGGMSAVKSGTAPFRESGREQIAAKTLRAFASNPDDVAARLANSKEIIPGSLPTAADLAQDAGVSQLQRTMSLDPQLSDDFAQRALDRNSARLAALNQVTKHADDLEGAVARRAAIGVQIYKKALGQKAKVDGKLSSLTERPAFQQALERARAIAANEGKPLKNLFDQEGKFASMRGLHYVKMGFDDLINAAPQSGIGKAELNAIRAARGELIDWMQASNPAYKAAMTRFEKASRPINQQEIVNALLSRATRSQVPNARGDLTIFPSSYGQAIKDKGANLVQSTLGRYGENLDDVMRPEQIEILQNVLKDAALEQAGTNFGRAVGSNTAQNLAGMNVLRDVTDAVGLPRAWAERNIFPSGARVMNLIYGGQEPLVKEAIVEALLNPNRAAEILRKAGPTQEKALLMRELLKGLPATTGSAISVTDR
jgi:surface antigen